MKRLLAIPAFLLVLVLFGLFALPYLIPQDVLRDRIAPPLEREAGIRLDEVKRISLTFSPEFGVAIEGVKGGLTGNSGVLNAMEASRIVAGITPSSLLEGRLDLRRLRLEEPRVSVRDGLIALGHLDKRQLAEPLLVPVTLSENRAGLRLPRLDVDIVSGIIDFQNRSGDTFALINGLNLALRHPAETSAISVIGDFDLEGQNFQLDADAEPAGINDGDAMILRADLRSQAVALNLSGQILFDGAQGFAGPVDVRIVEGQELANWLDADPAIYVGLSGANIAGQLNISGESLILSDARLTTPDFEGDLAVLAEFGRSVEAQLTNGSLHDGRASGALALRRQEAGSVLALSLNIDQVDSLALGRSQPGFDWLSGSTDVKIEINGRGSDWPEMVETLSGDAQLSVKDGAVEGIDLPEIVAQAKAGEFRKWQRRPGVRTPFDLMEASFQIEDGVARTSNLRITGPDVLVTGEGRTNFPRQNLKYSLQTRVTAREEEQEEGETAQFSMPIIIKGDWEKPDIYPDLSKILKDPDSVSGTAELFGKSVEKLTGGGVKADDFNKVMRGLFGKKKKKEPEEDEEQ